MQWRSGAVVPADAAPVDRAQVSAWVSATLPSEKRLHRFKWLFQDERSSAGGRGVRGSRHRIRCGSTWRDHSARVRLQPR